MLVRRLIPVLALTLGACDKGSESAGADGDADTDTDTDTDTDACDVCNDYGAAVPEVADFFARLVKEGPKAVADFKTSLANFISDAYGCTTGAYTGPSMEKAHAGMNITQKQYDDFIGLIAGQLAANGVPNDDITNCFAPPLVDPKFSSMIVGQ
jgi:hypothetical protein